MQRLVGIGVGHGAQQRLGIGMARVAEQFLGVGLLNQLADVHDSDLVRNVLNDAQIVSDKQIGQVELPLQVLQEVENLRLDRHVERRHGLVTDNKPRIEHDARAMPIAGVP